MKYQKEFEFKRWHCQVILFVSNELFYTTSEKTGMGTRKMYHIFSINYSKYDDLKTAWFVKIILPCVLFQFNFGVVR